MRLLTKGKGIDEFSYVEGIMRIEYDEEHEKIIIKCQTKDSQYIVEINKYECGDILSLLIFHHDEAVKKLLRWHSIDEITARLKEIKEKG